LRVKATIDHLELIPPVTHTPFESASRRMIERREHLRQAERIVFGGKRNSGAEPYPLGDTGYGGKCDVRVGHSLVEVGRFFVECMFGRRGQVAVLTKPDGFDPAVLCHLNNRDRIGGGLAGSCHEPDFHPAPFIAPRR
jgi:hypothetical protein